MPLLLMLVFSFVFTKFTRVNAHGAPYALFVYLGLVPWTFFASSLSTGGQSLVSNISLLNKLYCPREVFPLAAVGVALVDAIVAVLVLGLIFPIAGFAPKAQSYYVPLLLAMLFTFTVAVSVAVSAITVYLRDLRVLLPLVVQLGLFATPVAYGAHAVAHGHTQYLIYSALNPLTPIIDGLRRAVLFGHGPEWGPLGVAGLTSLLLLVGGFMLFKRLETGIADIA
jgi:ABC-2 type transport system permease protein/lipopolysaccharide transport system permease protein